MNYHKPVLLNEALNDMKVIRGGKYIDCTLGDGGHTLEILKNGGKVLGIDYNDSSLIRATKRIASEGLSENFLGLLGNFKDINTLAAKNGFNSANGILYDLGYSSTQLEESIGVSFIKDQPLDMRLDKTLGVTAADLVNSLAERELAKLFFEYGDEKYSRRFAKAIVGARNLKKLQTTKQLADLIAAEAPPGYDRNRIHPATRTFQALRIAVNDEIENLKISLPLAAQLLLPGGRMLIITFHSLEDKVVKDFGRDVRPLMRTIYKKPIVPTIEEVRSNNRARSAKMRVFEKELHDNKTTQKFNSKNSTDC